MKTYRLGILVCTLPERHGAFDSLIEKLAPQCDTTKVSIVADGSPRAVPTGKKRNSLLDSACPDCDFVAFVDDDDSVAPDYVSRILAAIDSQHAPDVIGIRGVVYFTPPLNGVAVANFEHSIECPGWYTGADGTYYRTPNHLNPVRSELALAAGFDPNMWVGEDRKYSNELMKLLRGKREAFIEEPIYFYNCRTDKGAGNP